MYNLLYLFCISTIFIWSSPSSTQPYYSYMDLETNDESLQGEVGDTSEDYMDVVINENPKLFITEETEITVYTSSGDSWRLFWKAEDGGSYLVDEPSSTYVMSTLPPHIIRGTNIIPSMNFRRMMSSSQSRQDGDVFIFKLSTNVGGTMISLARPPLTRSCSLKMVIDYPFEDLTREKCVFILAELQHRLDIVDRIFGNLDLDGNEFPDGVGFSVAGVDIYQAGSLIQDKVLQLNASDNFARIKFVRNEDVCAVVVLTHRPAVDFTSDVQICSPNANIVLVPLVTYPQGSKIPFVASTLHMAHQLGRLFGSPHDETPGDENIMTPEMLSGNVVNNYQFSLTSQEHMARMIALRGECLRAVNESGYDYLTPLTGPPPTFSSLQEEYTTSEFPEYWKSDSEQVDAEEVVISRKGHRKTTENIAECVETTAQHTCASGYRVISIYVTDVPAVTLLFLLIFNTMF